MALTDITDTAPPALPLDSIIHGDCLEVLRGLPDNSVDAIVTDPPAGISFMGKAWDNPDTFPLRDRTKEASKGARRDGGSRLGFARGFDGVNMSRPARDAFIAFMTDVMSECLRVLKPGGHALVWALPRTSHWTATALEDAGFEVRDCCTHLFGSGFPKSLDVSKQLDKMAGAKREVLATRRTKDIRRNVAADRALGWETRQGKFGTGAPTTYMEHSITAPATDAAQQWDGWGTALKPAAEFWWLCRKPLSESNVAANVLRWGTGALNIDGSRVGDDLITSQGSASLNYQRQALAHGIRQYRKGLPGEKWTPQEHVGRWPANLLLSHSLWCDETACALDCPIRALDAQSGMSGSGKLTRRTTPANRAATYSGFDMCDGEVNAPNTYGDTGGASRYFTTFRYTAKASRSERNRGCEALPQRQQKHGGHGHNEPDDLTQKLGANTPQGNHHPTVKSLSLMSWLITLITPPGGIVLDPFAGSGSTLCAAKEGGWRYIGIEKEAEYVAIARSRVQAS